MTEELRQDRRKSRQRVQAQVIRHVVLALKEASKRKGPLPEQVKIFRANTSPKEAERGEGPSQILEREEADIICAD